MIGNFLDITGLNEIHRVAQVESYAGLLIHYSFSHLRNNSTSIATGLKSPTGPRKWP